MLLGSRVRMTQDRTTTIALCITPDVAYALSRRRHRLLCTVCTQSLSIACLLIAVAIEPPHIGVTVVSIACQLLSVYMTLLLYKQKHCSLRISATCVTEECEGEVSRSVLLDAITHIHCSHSYIIFCATNDCITFPWRDCVSAEMRLEYVNQLRERLFPTFDIPEMRHARPLLGARHAVLFAAIAIVHSVISLAGLPFVLLFDITLLVVIFFWSSAQPPRRASWSSRRDV